MFAFVDGRNFYVSCERLFRPSLLGHQHGSTGAFDLDTGMWLPPKPTGQEETAQELMLRLLIKQRRTNDLSTELIGIQRQRPFRLRGVKA